MLTYILMFLAVLIGVYIAYVTMWADSFMADGIIGKLLGTVFFFICGTAFSAMILGLVVLLPVGAIADSHPEKTTTYQLQAIQMGEGISGTFFLGSGVINESNVYTFYQKNEDGSYQSNRIDADAAKIVESDTVAPHIEVYDYWLSGWIAPRWFGSEGKSYIVYVPTGSVKPLVNMDLPK